MTRPRNPVDPAGRHGPLAVGVDASPFDFTFYSQGVFYDKSCVLKPRCGRGVHRDRVLRPGFAVVAPKP